MKDITMKFANLAVLGALLAAGAANAQTYGEPTGNSTFRVVRGYISGTSPVTDAPIRDAAADQYINVRCGTAASITLIQKLNDGTVMNSTAVPCDTTPRTTSWTAPIFFEAIAASPTTAISTTTGGASVTLVSTKK